MFRTLILVMAAALLAACDETPSAAQSVQPDHGNAFSAYVDAEGNISRPDEFRKNWVHLGSWFVRDDDDASGAGVHDVYTTRAAVEAFRKHGQWQDGAVIVKTVAGINEKRLTTGNAQWAGDVGVWFVMVRDRKNRFPGNRAWGEGWGWALFKADNPDQNLTSNWKGEGFNNCFGCHAPVKDTEWVYIDGYPAIRDAARYPRLDTGSDTPASSNSGSMQTGSVQMH